MLPIRPIGLLTPEQEALLPAIRQEWQTNGLRADPVDWGAAERALTGLYEWAGLKDPIFIHFSSPMGCELALNYMAILEDYLRGLRGELGRHLSANLRGLSAERFLGDFPKQLISQIFVPFGGVRERLTKLIEVEEPASNIHGGIILDGPRRPPLPGGLRSDARFERMMHRRHKDPLEKGLWAGLNWDIAALHNSRSMLLSIRRQLLEPLWEQQVRLAEQFIDQLSEEFFNPNRQVLEDENRGTFHSNWRYTTIGPSGLGQLEGHWIAYYSFARSIGVEYPAREQEGLELHTEIARQCFFWYPFDGLCMLSNRPASISLDQRGRLHCEDGPALKFYDAWNIYAWHGVRVPSWIILRPDAITAKQILSEFNMERRRVMMYLYGLERALHDLGAELEQSDGYGDLYRVTIDGRTEKFVRVVNATPEADGTYRDYIIPVWPDVTTAHEAVARTYGRTPDTYSPEVRT